MPKIIKQIPCACGCGAMIPSADRRGRPRFYVQWHGPRTTKSRKEICATYYRKNRDKIQKWSRENKHIQKSWQLRANYNITLEDFQRMWTSQRGACAICGCVLLHPHVDHDHNCCAKGAKSCGKCIRGLLCAKCNTGLGNFRDDRISLMRAIQYITKHRGGEIMPLITIFECEPPCGKRIEISDGEIPGGEDFLQITDAMGKKFFFHHVDCLRKWLASYVSPYKRPEPAQFIPMDAILPGEKAN